jgi:hypothetical protein
VLSARERPRTTAGEEFAAGNAVLYLREGAQAIRATTIGSTP